MQDSAPPSHVCSAFGVAESEAEPLVGEAAWRYGGVVLRSVTDRAAATWLAETLAAVDEVPLRIARPIRARDGRWLVGGWRAARYVSGTPADRPDEAMHAAIRLHEGTARLPRPDFLARSEDLAAIADRVAWGEQDIELDEHKGGRWFAVLAGARQPVRAADQLVHGNLFGALLFDADAPPGVVDFAPFFRPAEWAAAVVAVDALAKGGAATDFLRRWRHLPEWPQMVLRAVLFRLAEHALDTGSTPDALDGLLVAAHEASELL